ncbi:MAG TPA: hypothetical protein VMD59_22315, partial [Acidimicrobiales bacterium]|nr:hypothetical protein [Acidimicrobiales bacterium]
SCPHLFTQAGGHPDYGITTFSIGSTSNGVVDVPDGTLKDVRVDLPPGIVPNIEALPQCPDAVFPFCPTDTIVGQDYLSGEIGGLLPVNAVVPVYNITPSAGLAGEFALYIAPLALLGYSARVNVLGFARDVPTSGPSDDLGPGVTMPADDGEYFEITSPDLPALTDTLVFYGDPSLEDTGHVGAPFLTLPSSTAICTSPQVAYLSFDSYEDPGAFQTVADYPTFVPASMTEADGCDNVVFPSSGPTAPTLSVTPLDGAGNPLPSATNDSTTGLDVDLTLPQDENPADVATPTLQSMSMTLPLGFTINPGAATTVAVCTDAQFGEGTAAPACPGVTPVGTVTATTPILPGAFTGNVWVGEPQPGNPYRLFVDVQGDGLDLRLEGSLTPDPSSGQLTATFTNLPPVPFGSLSLSFEGGAGGLIATPLACGPATATATLTPASGTAPATPTASVDVTGSCSGNPPFTPTVSAVDASTSAGAYTTLTLSVARSSQQQYLSQVTAELPPGLIGSIASVPVCPPAQAASGGCTSASAIGTATVSAGAGAQQLSLTGTVYLTGPYDGDPFGISIIVPADVGPFQLGDVNVQAGVGIDPTSARLVLSGSLPEVYDGVALHVTAVTIAITRPSFLFNPTNCGVLSINGTLGGSAGPFAGFTTPVGASETLSVPFQVTNCSTLPFSPGISASTSAKTSGANGAGLAVTITQPPGQANLRSVSLTLPKLLPARYATISQACPYATFAANPASCPAGSIVGTGTAATPVLAGGLSGNVYVVDQATVGLPTLDLVLTGDGVSFTIVGTIALTSSGLTTGTFNSIPDVPISSFALQLPSGPHSALAAGGSLCPGPLQMPVALTAQSGATESRTVAVTVAGCAPARGGVLAYQYRAGGLTVHVKVPGAGRLTASGRYLHTRRVTVKAAGTQTLTLALTSAGTKALAKHKTLRLKVKVSFAASSHSGSFSRAIALTARAARAKHVAKSKSKPKPRSKG